LVAAKTLIGIHKTMSEHHHHRFDSFCCVRSNTCIAKT